MRNGLRALFDVRKEICKMGWDFPVSGKSTLFQEMVGIDGQQAITWANSISVYVAIRRH